MRNLIRKIGVLTFLSRKYIISSIYTFFGYYKAFVWKVDLGKNIEISGPILFYTTNGSSISIGDNTKFRSSDLFNFRGLNHKCILQTGKKDAKIVIGKKCGFSGVSIVADSEVIIGDNVLCGANVMIGDRDDHSERYASNAQSVYIESNVWLGMNTIVLKGVRIGKGSIIGANSVVTKDIPENVIAAGSPCRVIKQI